MPKGDSREYADIDFRINLLYDAVYNESSENVYSIKPIIKKNIELINIKEPPEFDHSNVFDDAEIDYVGKNMSNWMFTRKSQESKYLSTLEFGIYDGYGNVNDLSRKELYNPAVHYMLSEIVLNEKFKQILLPIMFFDITYDEIKKLKNVIFEKMEKHITPTTKMYVFATERYFNMITLREYIETQFEKITIDHWRSIFFQVFYGLAKLTERSHKFRHNMLNLDAIRIYKISPEIEKYKFGTVDFAVSTMGLEVKITNFFYCSYSDYVKNRDSNIKSDNPYYDVHYFIGSIYHLLNKDKYDIPEYLKNFISDMIPEDLLPNINTDFTGLDERNFEAKSYPIVAPSMIIKKNNFFSKFITEDIMDLSASPVSSENKRITIKSLEGSRSPTDNFSDYSEKTEELFNREKISNYNSNRTNMISGIRRVIIPGYKQNIDLSVSEGGSILDSAERMHKNNVSESRNTESVFTKSKLKRQSEKKVSDSDSRTINLSDTANNSSDELSRAIADLQREHEEKKKNKKSMKSKKSRHQKRQKSSSSDSSTTQRSSSSSVVNHNADISKLDNKFAKQLDGIPANYTGEVPDHILSKLPSLGGESGPINFGQGGLSGLGGLPMMPPNMSQGGLGGLPMMPPNMSQGGLGGLPMMPPNMSQGGPQGGLPMMQNFGQFGGNESGISSLPLLPQSGEQSLQSGGGQQLYKFAEDKSKQKDFFF